jgi:PAS domain S-box-containing protein
MRFSEDQFRLFINAIPTLAWSCSKDGFAEFFNRRWLDYTGLPLEVALGWGWKSTIHSDDLPHTLEIFQEAFETGQPFEVGGRFRRFDGQFRRFLLSGCPLRDESGRVAKWYVTNTDLEDRIPESRLPETEQSPRQIIDSIPGFIITFTAQGEVEFVSRQSLEYVGKTIDELKQRSGDIFHPDDIPRLTDVREQSFKTGQEWEIERRIRRADGVYRWFRSRCVPQRDTEGRIVRWYNLLTDIDDRRRAKEDLREHEESFRLIVEGIDGHISIMNAEGGVEFVNNKGLEYFDKTLEELKAWATIDAVHPDDLPHAVAAWKRSVETGQPYDVDHRLRRFDGEYRWFHARGLSLRDAQDRIVRWYVLLTDIEDRKRAEDRLHLLLNLNNRVASHLGPDMQGVERVCRDDFRRGPRKSPVRGTDRQSICELRLLF